MLVTSHNICIGLFRSHLKRCGRSARSGTCCWPAAETVTEEVAANARGGCCTWSWLARSHFEVLRRRACWRVLWFKVCSDWYVVGRMKGGGILAPISVIALSLSSTNFPPTTRMVVHPGIALGPRLVLGMSCIQCLLLTFNP